MSNFRITTRTKNGTQTVDVPTDKQRQTSIAQGICGYLGIKDKRRG